MDDADGFAIACSLLSCLTLFILAWILHIKGVPCLLTCLFAECPFSFSSSLCFFSSCSSSASPPSSPSIRSFYPPLSSPNSIAPERKEHCDQQVDVRIEMKTDFEKQQKKRERNQNEKEREKEKDVPIIPSPFVISQVDDDRERERRNKNQNEKDPSPSFMQTQVFELFEPKEQTNINKNEFSTPSSRSAAILSHQRESTKENAKRLNEIEGLKDHVQSPFLPLSRLSKIKYNSSIISSASGFTGAASTTVNTTSSLTSTISQNITQNTSSSTSAASSASSSSSVSVSPPFTMANNVNIHININTTINVHEASPMSPMSPGESPVVVKFHDSHSPEIKRALNDNENIEFFANFNASQLLPPLYSRPPSSFTPIMPSESPVDLRKIVPLDLDLELPPHIMSIAVPSKYPSPPPKQRALDIQSEMIQMEADANDHEIVKKEKKQEEATQKETIGQEEKMEEVKNDEGRKAKENGNEKENASRRRRSCCTIRLSILYTWLFMSVLLCTALSSTHFFIIDHAHVSSPVWIPSLLTSFFALVYVGFALFACCSACITSE